MNAEICLKKLQYVGVLAFATVDSQGNPQIRNISAIHYEQDHWIERIFQEQPYLANVYPGNTREIGIVFEIRDGAIEYFNLGVRPIFRESYTIGQGNATLKGYQITEDCIGCGTCMEHCPQGCIEAGQPYRIQQEHCLHRGSCFEQCPVSAVKRLGGRE